MWRARVQKAGVVKREVDFAGSDWYGAHVDEMGADLAIAQSPSGSALRLAQLAAARHAR